MLTNETAKIAVLKAKDEGLSIHFSPVGVVHVDHSQCTKADPHRCKIRSYYTLSVGVARSIELFKQGLK